MNTSDLKDIWNKYDEKLEANWALNYRILKEIKMDKVQSAVRKIKTGGIIWIVIQHLIGIFLISTAITHYERPQILIPTIMLAVLTYITAFWGSHNMGLILKVDYNEPVTRIQENIQKLKLSKLKNYRFIFIFSHLYFWLGVIVLLKIDVLILWQNSPLFVIIQSLFVLAYFPFALWIIRKYSSKKPKSRFWKALEKDSLLTEDSVGKNINDALGFLEEIEEFKKEN
ncbi:hypothetical protein GWK08_13105 [Leptobacterium flavescens]|uniref:Uncharacterized protein n=1 Tax=Leptobacterium flavescens TaxID=472055 RepID=A0A6P0UME9_9FLAO|nr:hypothetical protein [Leptobacterium flavescens]NER14385.1 hypothetical protein [Leptobacterium flavescens]